MNGMNPFRCQFSIVRAVFFKRLATSSFVMYSSGSPAGRLMPIFGVTVCGFGFMFLIFTASSFSLSFPTAGAGLSCAHATFIPHRFSLFRLHQNLFPFFSPPCVSNSSHFAAKYLRKVLTPFSDTGHPSSINPKTHCTHDPTITEKPSAIPGVCVFRLLRGGAILTPRRRNCSFEILLRRHRRDTPRHQLH